MHVLSVNSIACVGGGLDAAGCRSDILGGSGIGVTLVGGLGLAAGPAGGAVGAITGLLLGGAVAARKSPACGLGPSGGNMSESRTTDSVSFTDRFRYQDPMRDSPMRDWEGIW